MQSSAHALRIASLGEFTGVDLLGRRIQMLSYGRGQFMKNNSPNRFLSDLTIVSAMGFCFRIIPCIAILCLLMVLAAGEVEGALT